jgi:hypothetical protein
MSLIEVRGAPLFGGIYYFNNDTQEEYSCLLGGLAWPSGGRPGWAVVIAKDRKEDEVLGRTHIRLLREYSSENLSDLLHRCSQYKYHLLLDAFYGDTTKASMMEFVRKLGVSFPIRNAPFHDDENAFEYYVNLIREFTLPSRKILHFGDGSKLPGQLMEAPQKRIPLAKAQDYPGILALGYALSAILQHVPDHEQEAELREIDAFMDDLYGNDF